MAGQKGSSARRPSARGANAAVERAFATRSMHPEVLREVEAIRAKPIAAKQSGFTDRTSAQIRNDATTRLRDAQPRRLPSFAAIDAAFDDNDRFGMVESQIAGDGFIIKFGPLAALQPCLAGFLDRRYGGICARFMLGMRG